MLEAALRDLASPPHSRATATAEGALAAFASGPLRGLRGPPQLGSEAATAAAAVAAAAASAASPFGSPPQTSSPRYGSPQPRYGSPRYGLSASRDSALLTPENVTEASLEMVNRSSAASSNSTSSPWRSKPSVRRSGGLGSLSSSTTSLAVALPGTKPVPERRGAVVSDGYGPRRVEKPPSGSPKQMHKIQALEEQLRMEKLCSAEGEEAGRLAEYVAKNADARVASTEQQQLHLEGRMAELANVMNGICKEQRIQEQRVANLEGAVAATIDQVREAYGEGWLEKVEPLEERLRGMEDILASTVMTTLSEVTPLCQRLEALEERATCVAPASESEVTLLSQRLDALCERGTRVAPAPETRASNTPTSPQGGIDADLGTAFLAVQELEGLLQLELKTVRNHCNMLQDAMDDRMLVPLRRLEQRVDEHDQKLAQCFGVVQECSSRAEEHEFRLGVARTKHEVYDQKFAILDKQLRFQRRNDADERSVASSTCWPLGSPTAPHQGGEAELPEGLPPLPT